MTAGSQPAAGLTFDGTGLLCVTLLLRLRRAIQDLAPGTVVHVIASDPAAPLDLPAWCHLTGHDYLGELPEPSPPTYALRITASAHRVDPARPWHTTP
ncbi:sulfurtransferase TusA family protein [Dactylosporangium sp. NPDC051484]|uniref:sulfurtransferase TusA family protein n=1 Tax=Dactylosporangium sp. NPDC051484 TaxID=3154942 RepID=UPI00344EB20F